MTPEIKSKKANKANSKKIYNQGIKYPGIQYISGETTREFY